MNLANFIVNYDESLSYSCIDIAFQASVCFSPITHLFTSNHAFNKPKAVLDDNLNKNERNERERKKKQLKMRARYHKELENILF